MNPPIRRDAPTVAPMPPPVTQPVIAPPVVPTPQVARAPERARVDAGRSAPLPPQARVDATTATPALDAPTSTARPLGPRASTTPPVTGDALEGELSRVAQLPGFRQTIDEMRAQIQTLAPAQRAAAAALLHGVGDDPLRIADVVLYLGSDAFSTLSPSDQSLALTAMQNASSSMDDLHATYHGLTSTPPPSTQVLTTLTSATSATGRAAVLNAPQGASPALLALLTHAHSPEAASALQRLVSAPAFSALPAAQQQTLLDRLQGGDDALQRAGAAIANLLDATGLPQADRARLLDRWMRHPSAEGATAFASFAQHAGDLPAATRRTLLRLIEHPRGGHHADADPVAMAALAGDADFRRLPQDAQATLLEAASERSSEWMRELRLTLGSAHARSLSGDRLSTLVSELRQVATPAGLQATREVLSSPAFQHLTPELRDSAAAVATRQTTTAGARALVTELQWLAGAPAAWQGAALTALGHSPMPASALHQLVTDLVSAHTEDGIARSTLRRVRGAGDAERIHQLVTTPEYATLDSAGRRAVVDAVVPSADSVLQRGRAALTGTLAQTQTPTAQLQTLAAAARVVGDPALSAAVSTLMASPAFSALPEASRISVLAAFLRNPTAETVTDLGRLVALPWFGAQAHDDQQRTLRTMETLLRTASESQAPRSTVLRNTLERVLGGEIALQFEDLPGTLHGDRSRDGTCCGGGHMHSTIRIDETHIPAGDGVVDSLSEQGRERILRTLPHEASHHTNNDAVAGSYEYFMAEYRAEFVGEVGFRGSPSPAWMLDWAHNLVAGRSGGHETYPDIARAAQYFGAPDAAGIRIVRFVNQFLPPAMRLPETPEGLARFSAADTDPVRGIHFQPASEELMAMYTLPIAAVQPDLSVRGHDLDN